MSIQRGVGGAPGWARPVRLLVVEDHPLLRDGVVSAVAVSADVECVGVAGSVAEAAAVASAVQPDVALLDYRLPDGTGADAAVAIRRLSPHTAFAVLTAEPSNAALLSMVEAGATAFAAKSTAADELVAVVLRVAAGEMLVPAAALAAALAERTRQDRADLERRRAAAELTARERDVLQLMAEGIDTAAIAADLDLAVTTVRWHTRNILDKLDAHSRLEAVSRAVRLGVIAAPAAP